MNSNYCGLPRHLCSFWLLKERISLIPLPSGFDCFGVACMVEITENTEIPLSGKCFWWSSGWCSVIPGCDWKDHVDVRGFSVAQNCRLRSLIMKSVPKFSWNPCWDLQTAQPAVSKEVQCWRKEEQNRNHLKSCIGPVVMSSDETRLLIQWIRTKWSN